MFVRLPESGRPAFMAIAGAMIGGVIVGVGPQVPAALDRPGCAETVMRAVSSDHTVGGSYGCFDNSLQEGLQTIGVDSDGSFAAMIGQDGDYHFVRKTEDGGYIYEYDRVTAPHDELRGAIVALGMPRIAADLRRGNLGAALNERHDVPGAWAEITGRTQNAQSRLFTIYVGSDGKISAIK